MAAISITPRDRLGFTLFLAASLHAAIILGVGFASQDRGPPAPTIEVTLAQHADREAPEDADFIAQSNQLGSGTETEARETTSPTEADFHTDAVQSVVPDPPAPLPAETRLERDLLATDTASEDQVTEDEVVPVEEQPPSPSMTTLSYDNLAQEIASLEARIAQDQQAQAKRPRVKRLTSVSTKSADEAAYLNAWRQKVERVGNANYPGGRVYGDLRLLVVLRYDGALEEVRLLESSGHKVLDDAALRIVRWQHPDQDFPVEMRKKYDRLEIIRTWQFSRSGARLTPESSLKNQFLIAMPAMTGSYFGDTIIYLCEHNDDGAMGLVINKPGELSLVELLGQLGMESAQVDAATPVMDGGPVARDRGFILHSDDQRFDASLDLGNNLMLTAAREVLEAIGRGAGPRDYLVALGYAGWDGGQLEDELKENAWLTCPASLDVVFREPFDTRVSKAAAALGIDFRLMSGQAGHA